MAITQIDSTPVQVIASTDAATAVPTGATDGYLSGSDGGRIRTFITYGGTVTAANIRLWVRNPATDTWHRGTDTDTLGILTPTGGNEARDWDVGEQAEFVFQLVAITQATGTITVHAVGVNR